MKPFQWTHELVSFFILVFCCALVMLVSSIRRQTCVSSMNIIWCVFCFEILNLINKRGKRNEKDEEKNGSERFIEFKHIARLRRQTDRIRQREFMMLILNSWRGAEKQWFDLTTGWNANIATKTKPNTCAYDEARRVRRKKGSKNFTLWRAENFNENIKARESERDRVNCFVQNVTHSLV